ncbi:tRNA dihydrouridine synthase [Desulfatitalea alkaliphila]|uniref:tRNA-dihydrouridine synthase n=1 Tax=Desulfatitalea alkaliphila TaxID=2929485 RepID=A0AA41R1S7_9BACT|nr:tRNA-dihydrouridine synthase family protein [Desulfatitalea alkaliphila]MCJ8500929.1 tRNA-dihydrouridine synthase family protein [Desulfatitalea alkaliphila]
MEPTLAQLIHRPLAIGRRTIPGRLVLAPMTLLGHVAFRHLLDELGGCGLMFSEMCGAARVPHENRHISACFRWRDAETDRLSIQLLGGDPLKMAAAARRIAAEGLFGVDINLGCAVKAVCKYNQGAALLRNPAAATDLVARVRRAVDCPLTVKFRTGWSDDPRVPVDLARRLEDAGADALTFHPRVAPDVRTRPARWEHIARVKAAVAIPVFGNGDVFDAADCLRMLRTTDCDGVALGRIAIARPWVFAHWGGGPAPVPTIHLDCARRLLDLCFHYFDPVTAMRRFKRYSAYLAANFAYGNTLYNRIRNAPDLQAIDGVLTAFFQEPPQLLQRPNLNLML